MSAIHCRAPLVAAACACLFASVSYAQTPAAAKAPARNVAAGPWARVPALPTTCFQSVATNQPDPFYARLEAAKTAVSSDIDKQKAINAKIEEEFNNIDPMVKAQRMQQWMMSNPQEAMAYMRAAQAAPAQVEQELMSLEQQRQSQEAEWKALMKSYDDARVQAYAPAEARRKALSAKLGYKYSSATKDLVQPFLGFAADPSTPTADWNEAESITGVLDQKYKALCPQWWGANGKFHAYMKQQKDWFVRERIPYLEKFDAPRLQNYAMMSTPAATYGSTAVSQGVREYLDLAWKVFNERDSVFRCELPKSCDGTYP
jgi:hypothetical protein